jgi:hypothetical protein
VVIVDGQIHLLRTGLRGPSGRIGQIVIDGLGVISAMDEAQVERADLVPPGSSGNQTCSDAVRRWPGRFRVMAVLSLKQAGLAGAASTRQSLKCTSAQLSFPPFREPSWLQDGAADWYWPVAREHRTPVIDLGTWTVVGNRQACRPPPRSQNHRRSPRPIR